MTHVSRGSPRDPPSRAAWSGQAAAAPVPRPAPAPEAWADPPAGVIDPDDPAPGDGDAAALPRLLSSGGVCAVFDRAPRTIRRWIRAGHLIPIRVGGALFFDPAEVRRLIDGALRAAIGRTANGPPPPPRGTAPASLRKVLKT